MESWLSRITDYLLAQSWQIAVLTILVAIVSFLLRNRSAHVRYLIWLLVLAKCLVPPLHSVPLAVLPQEQPIAFVESSPMTGRTFDVSRIERDIVTEPAKSTPIQAPMELPPKTTNRPSTYNIRVWLALGWLVGAVALLFYNLSNALRTQIWLQRQRKALPVKFRHNIESFFSAHGVKHIPNVWLINGMNQPFVWGLVRGSIYLPADLLNFQDSKSWASLLGHELSHVIRFDAIVHTLQIFAQVIFWFHPFVWWANRKIRMEREKCCDEMTIVSLHALPEDYSEAIVEALAVKYESIRPVPSLAVAGPVKNIEERIRTMLRPGKKFYKRPSLVTASLILLLGLLTVPVSPVLTALGQTEPGSERKPEITKSIYYAASVGDIEQIRLHIAKGSDVNEKTTTGDTALHYAVRHGREDVAKLLIANGAHVNEKTTTGDTALHYAVRYGHEDVAKLLIANVARVNERNASDNTPLHYAALYGQKNVAELLISKGADVSAKNKNGDLPIQLALRNMKTEVVDLLIAKGPTLSSIQMAAYQGDLVKVKRFLEQGLSVDSRDSEGHTALHFAVLRGKRDVVEFLLSQGADVNLKDKSWGFIPWGFTPLKYASSKDIVELLISKGANVNAKDKYGWTPLDGAVWHGQKDIAETLIRAGANVNSRYNWGETPLIWAAQAGHTDIVDLLIANGAEIDARDNQGRTPLYHSAWRGYRDVAELLISKVANVNARDLQGRSPLWIARNTGPKQIAEMLRKYRNDRWWEKATSAEEHMKIAEMLSKHGAKE